MPHPLRSVLRHCQVAVTTLVVLAAAALILGVWWVNRQGFTGQWGAKVTEELSRRGIHAEFQSVRFSPWRGLLAHDVVVYADPERSRVLAEVPLLQVDVDRADALRGKLNLRKLRLKGAEVKLPYSLPGPGSRDLMLSGLTADVVLNREGRLTLSEGSGLLGGVDFDLNVDLDGFELARLSPGPTTDEGSQAHSEFVQGLLLELSNWGFPDASPPRVELELIGDMRIPAEMRTTVTLSASELSRKNYTAESVYLSGEYHRDRLTIDRFEFSDGAGALSGRADYVLSRKSGRYEVNSDIHLGRLLRTCFNVHALDDIVSARAPTVAAEGEFMLGSEAAGFQASATGHLAMPTFRFLGHRFASLATEFAWNNGDIFLRDLEVRDDRGGLHGDVRIKGDEILYKVVSSFFPDVFDPFIEDNSGLDRTIKRAGFASESRIRIEATGRMQRSNLRNWSSRGTAHLQEFSYNEVALKSVTADYRIDSQSSSYDNITAVFDYADYPLRNLHGGPNEATVEATRIGYDRKTKITTIENLHGTAWPAPLLKLFAPRTAGYVERTYPTRRPPVFTANGTVAELPPHDETDVKVDIRIPGITDYEFLGRPLQLRDSSLDLRVRREQVDVSNLAFSTFSGDGGGRITVFTPPGKPTTYNGDIKWTRLHLAEIGRTYGFDKAKEGLLTGYFEFTGAANEVRRLNGQGALGLENGHLFYVPVLGPLSTILGEIVGDKRGSHEAARDASCTFAVKDGILHTSDFLTSTPSSVFTGEGHIDLDRSEIDMTIRMNARGLLGLITLPLRPLTGLFQFRGIGPLRDPNWRNSSFTTPARGKDDPIFRKPARAQIVEE